MNLKNVVAARLVDHNRIIMAAALGLLALVLLAQGVASLLG